MEKIVFGNAIRSSAKELDRAEIRSLGDKLGEPIPTDLVAFYETVNGGYFLKNCWKTPEDNIYIVGQILPIKHSLSSSKMLLENSYKTLREKDLLPKGCVPFAVDMGGNYFCVRSADGKVFWLNHEKTQFEKGAIVVISDNLKTFISGLLAEENLEDYL